MDVKEIKLNIALSVANGNVNALIAELAQCQYDLEQAKAKITELESTLKLPPDAR